MVVAIAVAALARVGSQALNTQFEAEQRTLALWVADNQIAELRLEPPAPSERRQGSSRMGGRDWYWDVLVQPAPGGKDAASRCRRVRGSPTLRAGDFPYRFFTVMNRFAGIQGYTLVEVLVAVLVFSVLAASAYGALDGLSRAAIDQREHAGALAELQLTMARLDADLRQLTHRATRNPLGQLEPPLSGSTRGPDRHARGWGNPSTLKRSDLQRFGWQYDNSVLSRLTWAVTDPSASSAPQVDVLDLELNDFKVAFSVILPVAGMTSGRRSAVLPPLCRWPSKFSLRRNASVRFVGYWCWCHD